MFVLTSRFSLKGILISAIVILLLASSVTGFFLMPKLYYYGSIVAFGLLVVFSFRGARIGPFSLVLFLAICAFSIMINDPPKYFRAWQRYFAFILIIVTVAPLFTSIELQDLRRQLFTTIMWFCVILSLGSFICFFLGINYFVRNDEVLSIEAGHFSGLFCHSMLLGPIAGLSAIYTFVAFLSQKKNRILLLIISICCIGSNLLSASRGAIGACILGLFVAYMFFFRNNMSRGLIIGLFAFAILAASFPLWSNLTEFVMTKQENNIVEGGTFISRESIWAIRASEIRNHPFTGVGFCCVDSGITYVDNRTGVIEPGSSWLAVFSMTGILGFISFLLLFIQSVRKATSMNNQAESCLMCASLAFFAFHLVIEGYILAAGSFLCILYWLLLGCIWGEHQNRLSR